MFKNIMLAVDGSAYTDSILSHGIALAKTFKSHLLVLTVADVRIFEWASAIGADGFVSIVPSGIYQDESRQIMEDKCKKVLQKCAKLLSKEKLDFETETLIGSPVDLLLERSQISDLVIMGKRGEFERWDKKALGVTVDAVSRALRKPLIVVKVKYRPTKKILVGYDGSDHANQALQFVGHLAEGFSAEVIVLCVTDDEDLGKHYCREAENYLNNYKISIQAKVISGTPDEELVRFAEENNFDMLAIGAYGHSRIREAILGSTTEHILRFSGCPVLLAK